ncbi:MAG: VCBS repeat-containing protein [Rhodanobacteraceae bacterium]|nr:VCBS repeat-containing protein [Rhodanobacteraceae bacterium]
MPKHRLGAALALALLFCATADAAPFGFAAPVSLPTYGDAESVAIGDVSGDGRDDLVVVTNAYFTNSWSNHVLIYAQQADGTLAPPQALPYTTTYGGGRGLVLADIDDDGVLDIVAGYGGGLALLRRDGAGGFNLRNVATSDNGSVLTSLDVDRNGVADIIGLSYSDPARIYLSDGLGGIASQQALATQAGGWNDLEIGDLNGDGIDDLAVMSGQGLLPNLTVHRHDGISGWLAPLSYVVGTSELTRGLAIGDFNNDGRDDAVMSRGYNSPTWLWRYQQDASGQLQAAPNLASYQVPSTVESTDLDQDGRDDLAVLHSGWSRLGFYLQGEAGLEPEQLVAIPYQSHYNQQGLAFGDLNGDGCTDAAVALNSDGVVTLSGHDCAPTADLAVAIRGEAHRTVAIDVNHRAGAANVVADVLVEFRTTRSSRINAPSSCIAQPSLERVYSYRCTTAALSAGGSATLRFALSRLSQVVVSADVASNAPDPDESNNAATATVSF